MIWQFVRKWKTAYQNRLVNEELAAISLRDVGTIFS